MKRFRIKRQKAASIESRFEASKPLPPEKSKPVSQEEKNRILKMWGPDMGKTFVQMERDRRKSLGTKTKAEYKKKLAKWSAARSAAIAERTKETKRQEADERNRYYACSICGLESASDSRMGSLDLWSNCQHNDRYIQQRDRRQNYTNSNDRDYR